MATSYRVGVIGCGSIAQRHTKAYQSVQGFDLVVAAEPNTETARTFQETFAIPTMYADPKEMLQKESLDVVSICTWHGLHAPQTLMAAEHGAEAVLCEKPMAVNLDEADQMITACRASGTKLAIGHQRRFYPGWTEARRLINEGAVGKPVIVTGYVVDGLLNTGSHVIDGMRYVLGDPQAEWVMGAVERKTNRWERDVPIEDCCLGLTSFAGGVQALLQVDLTPYSSADHFTVQGAEGLLMVAPDSLRLISADNSSGEARPTLWDTQTKSAAGLVGFESYFHIAYTAQAQGLKAWLDGESEYRGEGTQTRHTVEIMMALYQSVRAAEVTRLPLTEGTYPLSAMVEEGNLPLRYPEKYDIRDPQRRTWIYREAYDRMRVEGLSHPEIMAALFKK
jgi:predicted dehydrogenase